VSPLRRVAALLAAVALVLAAAQPAGASNHLRAPASLDERPDLRQRTGNEVAATAARDPEIRAELRRQRGETRSVYLKGATQWQVSWFERERRGVPRKEIAQATVDDRTGAVLEAYTGFRVAWTMARGYDGAFGRKVNDPVVWIGLLVLFVLPFLDPRRPWRWLHLDVLVLAGFSVSLVYFNAAEVETSVPLVYPLLVYLLVRMLLIGLRRGPVDRPHVWVPAGWLAVGIVFLAGFRIGLNLTDSNVIDVGYAGVIGADKLADGDPLYGGWPADNAHGDTYGPVAYAAYVPFEQALPWSGSWDDLPAAHGAALAFDLLTMAGIFLLGRRMADTRLGLAATYAWAAFPFTLYASNTNANDSLVSLLLVATLLVAASAPARGALAGLAGMAKFAPLALAPLLATYGLEDRPWPERLRRLVLFGVAFAAVVGAALLLTVDDLGLFYERTIAFQADRDAPFSVWGLYDLEVGRQVAQAGAVVLALVLAVVPRRRGLVGLAALCAAVLIALQLGASYWFYLYLVWFFPFVVLALLAPRSR
jgi:hypothetical protein